MRTLAGVDRAVAWAGIGGVAAYVATWAVLGATRRGYDPLRQAISELYAVGAPVQQARTMTAVLVITGVLLVPFAWTLHRRLPGRGALGAWLVVYSGVMTAAVAFFPCSAACPGYGTTFDDSVHVITAGSGYLALVLAPLAFGYRVRHKEPGFAAWSWLLGAIATAGFVIRTAGVTDALGGLQQRFFNTTADLWLALAAAVVLRGLARGASPERVTARGDTAPAPRAPTPPQDRR
ncbi:MAG: DUF998 domain-containing protein [Actinobacteria bacterium]|nr:DUF998 domain-containing protein [Actinomycetota bacterium]